MGKKIKYVKIEAENNYEFGFKLGKVLSKNIKRRIRKNKKIYRRRKISYSKMIRGAKKFAPAVRKKYPLLLEELRGMSVGSDVPFEDLLVMQCEEELLDFPFGKCTSLAVKTKNGEIYLGHNEDWLKEYLRNGMVIVSGRIGKLKFLSLTYMGALVGASCSLNSHGLAFTGNSLNFKRFRFGIPRNFSLRALLETKNIREAEKIIKFKHQSIASNILLVFRNTIMEDIEKLWLSYNIFHGHRWIVHTNNPLVKSEQDECNTNKESIERCERAYEILSKKKSVTIETLKEVLRDHETGICGHYNRKHPTYGITIASAIIDPREQWMEVCHSNPCKHRYIRYNLK